MGRFVGVEGTRVVGPGGKELLLRGVGIGNWLLPEGYMFDGLKEPYNSPRGLRHLANELIGPEASDRFWEQFEEVYFTPADVARIAADGFNSIRIAFDWKALFDPETLKPRERGFARLDRVLQACERHGIWAVLDLHGAPGGQNGTNIDDGWGHPWLFESPRARRQVVALWRTLAGRYADSAIVAGYDLLNEPLPAAHAAYNPLLEPLYRDITAAIREVDRNHVIILEGANWDTDFTVFGEPFDDRLVYQFHKYWNATDAASIQPFLDFRERHRVPVWCGETGENTIAWYRACSALLAEHAIGWNLWPYKKRGRNPSPYNLVMPPEWKAVQAYAAEKVRPDLPTARAAFDGLLKALPTEACERDAAAIEAWLHPGEG